MPLSTDLADALFLDWKTTRSNTQKTPTRHSSFSPFFYFSSAKLQSNPWCKTYAPIQSMLNFHVSQIKICFPSKHWLINLCYEGLPQRIGLPRVLCEFSAEQGKRHVNMFCGNWSKTDSVLSYGSRWLYPNGTFSMLKDFWNFHSQKKKRRITETVMLQANDLN